MNPIQPVLNTVAQEEEFARQTSELALHRLKIIAALGSAIFTLFIAFRFYWAPEDIESTLAIRLGGLAANIFFLGIIHFRVFPRASFPIALLLNLSWIVYLEALIVAGDSTEPRQFHAVMMLVPCWAMLVPMKGRQCALLVVTAVIGHWTGFTMAPHLTERVQMIDELAMLAASGTIGIIATSITNKLRLANFQANIEIERERQRSEELLSNMLPEPIAKRLKDSERDIADGFADVSILFADVCNFTELSSELTPEELVMFLNGFFSMADKLADRHGLEKIKTIGDSYMVAAGLPEPRVDHKDAIARFAIELRDSFAAMQHIGGRELQLRIGLNSGPVVAGVIGRSKLSYDLWGDTVNVAARMEAAGTPGSIQLPEGMALSIEKNFQVRRSKEAEIKGKGRMDIWVLVGELQ